MQALLVFLLAIPAQQKPTFDPSDLEKTAAWASAWQGRLLKDANNEIRYKETLEVFDKEMKTYAGKKVRWVVQVRSISETKVTFEKVVNHQGNEVGKLICADLLVGEEIQKETAAKLNPGDKITIAATIESVDIEGKKTLELGFRFVLDNVRIP